MNKLKLELDHNVNNVREWLPYRVPVLSDIIGILLFEL